MVSMDCAMAFTGFHGLKPWVPWFKPWNYDLNHGLHGMNHGVHGLSHGFRRFPWFKTMGTMVQTMEV